MNYFLANNLLEHNVICTTKCMQYFAFKRTVMTFVSIDSQGNIQVHMNCCNTNLE